MDPAATSARVGGRLVDSPVFVLCSIRSGSTLLRCILDTHSEILAPHELHLADLSVLLTSSYVQLAMGEAALDQEELEHLLWDRVMHRLLARSGKRVFVDKTPGNLLLWPRLRACWPGARFIFLVRHPVHILASATDSRPEGHPVDPARLVDTYLRALAEARGSLPGLTVRYEDLTADPQRVSRELCQFLDVEWEPAMTHYGRADHGRYQFGIGDFGDAIGSGQVLPNRRSPAPVIPEELRWACAEFGYAG